MAAIEKLTFEMNAVGNAVPQMKAVQAQLGNVSKSMNAATASLQKHANVNRALTGSSKNLTRNLGMASLQFQDIAVQASMGTDALRIMTMQGPQLASVFGPKGMIVGALVAVGGAMAMMRKRTTRLTFDFKQLGKDIKPAFQPFIDFVKPAIDAVGRAFTFLKKLAMTAINGVVNGIQVFAVFVSNLPAIVGEAFRRAGKHIKLFGNNVAQMVNQIKFKFVSMFSGLTADFAAFVNDTAKTINQAFNLNLPTDIGEGALDGLVDDMRELNNNFEDLIKEEDKLRDQLKKPYESITNLKDDLENITKIDLFSYFDRVKIKSKETGKELQKITTIGDMIGSKFGDAFTSMVKGTKSAKDAFRALASDIISELFRIFVIKKITGFITAGLSEAFPSFAAIDARANGGPVSANKPYIVGERGPELMIPGRSGMVVPNNKLGGETVVVNQTINVTTGVQQTVRAEIRQLMPQIADSAKAAVSDAKRRGGSYGRAFA